MGHVLWLVPDTIITARLSLPIKGEEKQRSGTKKKGGEKDTGDEKKHKERDPTTAPTVPSPRVQLFPFVFLLPLSRPKNTPAPLPFHLFFIPSSSSLSQPPAASLVLEISVTEPPSLQQPFPLINSPPFSLHHHPPSSAHHLSPTRRATIE